MRRQQRRRRRRRRAGGRAWSGPLWCVCACLCACCVLLCVRARVCAAAVAVAVCAVPSYPSVPCCQSVLVYECCACVGSVLRACARACVWLLCECVCVLVCLCVAAAAAVKCLDPQPWAPWPYKFTQHCRQLLCRRDKKEHEPHTDLRSLHVLRRRRGCHVISGPHVALEITSQVSYAFPPPA